MRISSLSTRAFFRDLVRAIPALDGVRSAYHLIGHSKEAGYLSTAAKANLLHSENYIFAHWCVSNNFGDAISPVIVQSLSDKIPLPVSKFPKLINHECYSVVGSVLHFRAPSLVIWGSGFIRSDAKFWSKPKRVCAVRGPLTRKLVLDQGVDCPDIYGDPAVLMFDHFAGLQRTNEFDVGLLPHYYDATHPGIKHMAEDERVELIDVLRPVAEIAEAFARCKLIVSSSLHGLILADAMGIPSRWLGVSEMVKKGGFKFYDYFASVDRRENEPLPVEELSLRKVVQQAHLRIRPFSRDRLLDACPFRRPGITEADQLVFPPSTLKAGR